MTIIGERANRYLLHDRDGISPRPWMDAVASMDLRVMKTPARRRRRNAQTIGAGVAAVAAPGSPTLAGIRTRAMVTRAAGSC
jgi:hypothetical protein